MSELFIKQELFKVLPQIDALIFDIDGVLLDVSASFRVAIQQTAQFYATEQLHLEDTGPLIELEETELFKFAGKFNDDWDLTNAVVALVVAKWAQTGARTTSELREASPTWREYTAALKRKGGGLAQAESFILEMLSPTQRRDFARGWNAKLVTRIFQEMYAGDDKCRELYGFEPEYFHGEGLYKAETTILNPEFLPKNKNLGILTGRALPETKLGLFHARLLQKIPETNWVTASDDLKKPDGRTLLLCRERLDFKVALYIGDTLDDLQAVFNYREFKGAGKARIFSAICLSGPSGDTHKREFLEAGAEIVAPDVNFLLQYLGSVWK